MKCLINKKTFYKTSLKKLRIKTAIPDMDKKKELYDVIGERFINVGIVDMNKDHKNNILTEGFIDDVRRTLQSMEIDEMIKCVIFKSKNDEVFSIGTDLNTLYYKKMSGDLSYIDNYFEKLYNFQHFLATFHKPLFSIANGTAKGSGVSILASCNFPLTTPYASASFPETGFGYVPDCGSTFHLSSMKGEIGTFMALTGYRVNDSGLSGLGLTYGFIKDYSTPLYYEISEKLMSKSMNQSINKYEKSWEEDLNDYKNDIYKKNNIRDNMSSSEMYKLDFTHYNKVFEYPWKKDNINKDTDPQSMKNSALVNDLIKINSGEQHSLNLKNYKGVNFTNSLSRFENTVIPCLPISYDDSLDLNNISKEINRCFRFDTIEEIIEALKEENSIFSNYCLEKMEKKSPISLAVTLRLLRNAKKMDYSEIIRQEINVAKNIILKSKDFHIFMENKINNKKTNWNKVNISKEEVDSYFDEVCENINLDLKPFSLLPNKNFITKYPDCFKFLINENKRANYYLREFYDYESFHFLIQNYGIDMRDTRLTLDELRRTIGKIEKNEKIISTNKEILLNFINDQKLVDKYIIEKENAIYEYSNNPEKVKEIIQRKIKEKFEKNFKKTCKTISESCNDVQNFEKRRTWLRLRKWVFFNRIMEYKNKKSIIRNLRIESLGPKKFFIPDKLDVNFRDFKHPDIHKSPYYKLAGLFKLKNSTPNHLMNSSDIFKTLELNKEKLSEIKLELKENPNKFIDVWSSVLDKEFEKYYEGLDDESLLEYEKSYRLKNEGRSVTDTFPLKYEYERLKKNWKEYKTRVIEHMRELTIEMLYDIIKNEEDIKTEDYKALYDIIKIDDKIEVFNFDQKENILKENIKSSILNDEFYKLLDESENKHALDLKEKFINMIEKLIVFNLGQSNEFSLNDLQKNISSLFRNGETSMEFIDFIYTKYSTKGLFNNVLNNSKASVISLMKETIDAELHHNFSILENKTNKFDVVLTIYEKEKSALEDLLKNFYELKINLILLELNEKSGFEKEHQLYSIDEILQFLKDMTFSQIVLNEEKIPHTLGILLDDKIESKERQLVELYVYLKDHLNKDSTIGQVLSNLTNTIKSASWYDRIKQYLNMNNITTLDLEDFVNKNNKRKLDENIENFMKQRFTQLIYNKEDQDYTISTSYLNELINSKGNYDYISSLVKDYKNDDIVLNENIYNQGFHEDITRQNKIKLYELKLKLIDRINKFNQHYDVNNLKTKYSDYIYNKNYYMHKILCYIKDEIYLENVNDIKDYGKFLLNVKIKIDVSYNETMKKKVNYNFNDFEYFSKVQKLYIDQKSYLDNLEKLNSLLINNKYYKEKIFSELFNILDYTNKYDVIVLTNNPQCDCQKLNSYLTENIKNGQKRLKIDYTEFIIIDEYTKLLSNYEETPLEELIIPDFKNNVQDNVKTLVSYEVLKFNKDINEKDINLDNAVNKVIEKEKEVYDELIISGKLNERDRYIRNPKIYLNSKLSNDKLSQRVSLSLNSLKDLNKIVKDPNNIAKNDIQTVKEFIEHNVNPGLKFNKMIDLIYGKKKSIRTLIVDEDEMLPNEYLKENDLNSIFTKKIPLDLVKTALNVYDARLIKALKLELGSMIDNNMLGFKLNNTKQNQFKLPFSIIELKNLYHDLELSKEEIYKMLLHENSTESQLSKNNDTLNDLEYQIDQTLREIYFYYNGSIKILHYKDGSLFDKIFLLNNLKNDNQKNNFIIKLLNSLKQNIDAPNFSDKYSLLKYVYDYYMGTLYVFYDNHIEDTLARIESLNEILFYDKLEKYYFTSDNDNTKTGLISFLNTKMWEKHFNVVKDKISFEKEYNQDNEIMMDKRMKNFKKFAKELPYKSNPNNWNWIYNLDDKYSKYASEELKKNIYIWYYQHLKNEGILEEKLIRKNAEGMYLTDSSRKKNDLIEKHTNNLRNLSNNLYDNNNSTPIYNKLLNQDRPFNNVFEELFSDYFKIRKERLEYTKDKISENKEYSNVANLNKNYYDPLKKTGPEDIPLDIQTYLKTNSIRKEYPIFGPEDIIDIVELDNASSYAQYGNLASMPSWLLENEEIIDLNSLNVTPKEWFENIVEEIIDEFFEKRKMVEKHLTRDELRCLDNDFSDFFKIENILSLVKDKLNDEIKMMYQLSDSLENSKNGKNNNECQMKKVNLNQYEFNKAMKNENAAYMSLAYSFRKEVEFENNLKQYLSSQKTESKRYFRRFIKKWKNENDPFSLENYYIHDLNNSVFRENKDKESDYKNKKEMNSLGITNLEEYSKEKDKIEHSERIIETSTLSPFKKTDFERRNAMAIIEILKNKSIKH